VNFQDSPAGLGLNARWNARKLCDNRKLIASARDGKEWTLGRPRGNGRIGGEAGNGEALGQQTEFKMTGRGGH
jgi:hypothetical protein